MTINPSPVQETPYPQPRSRRLLRWLLWSVSTLAVVSGLAAVLVISGGGIVNLLKPIELLSDAEYLSRGTDAFAADRLPQAIAALTRALERNPANTTARLLLGRAYLGMSKNVPAQRELERARQSGAPYPAYAVFLAQALIQQGKYRELLDGLGPAPGLPTPVLAELLALRAQAQLRLNDLPAAQQELGAAQEIAPQHPAVRLSLIRLGRAQGWRAEQALSALGPVLNDLPGYAPAWSLQGDLALTLGDYPAAEAAYSKALAQRYGDAADFINRALARILQGNRAGAQADIAAARERLIEHPGILFAEALLLLQRRHYTEAWNKLERTLERDPKYRPALFYLALAHYGLDQWRQGMVSLARYLRRDLGSPPAVLLLASGALLQGEFGVASRLLQDLLVHQPAHPKVVELLGYAQLAQGDIQDGIARLRQVAQPQAAAVHARLGFTLSALGEYGQAWDWLDQAAALAPEQATVQALRVLSRVRTAQPAAALALSEQLGRRQPESPLAPWLAGLAHQAQGEVARAAAAFTEALDKRPDYLPAVLQLTGLALATQQPEPARERLLQALERQPENPILRLALAELETQAGNTDGVRRQLKAVLAHQPDALVVRLRLAGLELAARQPKQAVAVLQQTPAGALNEPSLQELLGRAQLVAGYFTDAAQTLRSLAWSRPSAWHRFLLALAYAGQGDSQAAQQELDRALDMDPRLRPAQLVQTRRLIAQGRLDEAERRLATLDRTPADAGTVLTLEGELALARHQPQRAVELLDAARRQQQPASRRLTLKLAQAHYQAGEAAAAMALYQAWLTEHPDDSAVQLTLADAYLQSGRSADAEAALGRFLELRPDDPAALNKLGWLLRHRDPEQALEYTERALEQAPNNPAFKGTLALILLEQGEKQRARLLLENSLSEWSASPSMRFCLVQALVHTGARQSARRVLQQMLADTRPFPERPQAQALLSSLVN